MKTTSAVLPLLLIALLTPGFNAIAQVTLTSDTNGDPLFGTRFIEDGKRIWFSATSFSNGGELWLTNGTPAGTMIAGEAFPGTDGHLPEETIVVDGKAFYFVSGDSNWELWSSDGTQAGTMQLVPDARPSFTDSNPAVNGLAEINGLVVGFDDEYLFALDPASLDTTRILEVTGESLVQTNDFVYAFTTNPSGLWRTDGTVTGTEFLTSTFFETDEQIGLIGNTLIFVADDFSGSGEELFVSNGTIAGSGYLPEIGEGDIDIACNDILPGAGVVYMGIRTSTTSGCIPYQSDGTAAGTVPIIDASGLLIHSIQEAAGYIFYWEDATKLWRTDGTVDGTILLAETQGTSTGVVEFDGIGWFAGFVDGTYALWQTDGTVDGTVEVFRNAIGPVDPFSITVIGNRLYFSAFNTYYIESTSTSIDSEDLPRQAFELDVFPNPFKEDVTVRIHRLPLATDSQLIVSVHDLLGREIQVLEDRNTGQLEHQMDLAGLPSGVYIVRVESGSGSVSRKVVKL